ncbi:GspH/FimT family pseudopilin [Pseudomonas sp. GOM6]|uniref:GspH/FimT family pseudopilin n=1 Tax=Pseudomonas sp. GOM6 TaxID=3036944 RepID=UPI00240A3448|nr:GspH/FimT family pseudopilin [Pseudomonas sp. GOM6]MDG1582091.1 GspH/FimT family pseudopilin [Pseudomonas sp. GOM6]
MVRYSRGFTLVELMTALAVLAVLLGLGLPAFSGLIERSRADTDMNGLQRALSTARLEAINTSQNRSVVAAGGWSGNLEVRDAVGNPVRKLKGMAGGAVVAATNDVTTIQFNNLGGLQSPTSAVDFAYTRGSTSKTLTVCPTGRIVVGAGGC